MNKILKIVTHLMLFATLLMSNTISSVRTLVKEEDELKLILHVQIPIHNNVVVQQTIKWITEVQLTSQKWSQL